MAILEDAPELKRERTASSVVSLEKHDAEKARDAVEVLSASESDSDVTAEVIEKAEDVAVQVSVTVLDRIFETLRRVQVISTQDDSSLPVFTFRAIFLGVGLSIFSAVLATIYTFKPQVRGSLDMVNAGMFKCVAECVRVAVILPHYCLRAGDRYG